MTENPPRNPGNVTNLAAPDRVRWLAVLRSLLNGPVQSPTIDLRAALKMAEGHNRAFVIACLRGVHSARSGSATGIDFGLPRMPLPLPASQGSRASELVWLAYLKFVMGDPSAAAWLGAACDALDPTALKTTASDNPEPWWQNEMLMLHALHSYALIHRDGRAIAKTLACADFHIREIQPDHATNEPWAAHAYASHIDGRVTAETLLHSAQIQNAGKLTEVSRLIVSDAVAALEAAASA